MLLVGRTVSLANTQQLIRMRIRWVFGSGVCLVALLNSFAQTAGDILWEFDIQNNYSFPALATDGTIYVGGSNKLYAIKPNGTLKWHFPINYSGHPVLGPDGTIYVGESSRFVALNPAGTMKWAFLPGGTPVMRAAVGGDGTIYLTIRNILQALAPNGSRRWSYTNQFADPCAGAPHFGLPAIGSDGTVYVSAAHPDNRLFAFSTNGMTNWTFSTGRLIYEDVFECGLERRGELWSAPAIGGDGTVYVGACLSASDMSKRHAALYAINSAGTTNWHCFIGGNSMGEDAPAIGPDGTIYMRAFLASPGTVPSTNKLVAINRTGSNIWQYVLPGFWSSSSPVVTADERILIGTSEGASPGRLFTVGLDGANPGFFSIPGLVSHATVGPDGTIYAVGWSGRPGEGKLYAIAGDAAPANTPWPMFQRDSRQSGRGQIPATTPPTLLSLRRIAGTDLELSYAGQLSRDYRIEASSDLLQWRVVNTFFTSSERVGFRDSAAADANGRYYRLVSP